MAKPPKPAPRPAPAAPERPKPIIFRDLAAI